MPIKLLTGPGALHKAKTVREAFAMIVEGSILEELTPRQLRTIESAFYLGCSIGLHVQDQDLNKFVKEIEDYADSIKQFRQS